MSDRSSHAPDDAPQVVSLSARDVPEAAAAAGELRTMLDEAREMAERLAWRLTEVRRRERTPVPAVDELEERLVLGARMLKAFEVQLGRAEATVAEIVEQREQAASVPVSMESARRAQVDALREQVEENVAGRLGEMRVEVEATVDEARRRLDDHLAQREAIVRCADDAESRITEAAASAARRLAAGDEERERAVERVDEGIAALGDRVSGISRVVETAEVACAAMSPRLAQLAARLEARDGEAERIGRECEQAREAAAAALADAMRRIESLREDGDMLEATVQARLLACEATEVRLAGMLDRAEAAVARLDVQPELCDRLEGLLARLAPWERLLLAPERAADGTPRPVASMIESLRTNVGQDMAELSTTMHALARRVEGLIPDPVAREHEEPQERTADVVTKPLRFKGA
ncbi:MAG: hypothetical protein GY715_06310 [Planctomycetes bacterium]|nr:hypothetical protein [Planctomycetota bacterium]